MGTNEIYKLAKEYVADPNCKPELWISDQGLNNDEKKLFHSFVSQLTTEDEAELAFFKSHPELNP